MAFDENFQAADGLTAVSTTRRLKESWPIGTMPGPLKGNPQRFINQRNSAAAGVAIAVVGRFILLKMLNVLMGLRVTQNDEIQELDLSRYGKKGKIFVWKMICSIDGFGF